MVLAHTQKSLAFLKLILQDEKKIRGKILEVTESSDPIFLNIFLVFIIFHTRTFNHTFIHSSTFAEDP